MPFGTVTASTPHLSSACMTYMKLIPMPPGDPSDGRVFPEEGCQAVFGNSGKVVALERPSALKDLEMLFADQVVDRAQAADI